MAKRRAAPRFQGVGSRPSGPSSAPPPEASGFPFLGLTPAPVWVPPKPWGSAGPPRPSMGMPSPPSCQSAHSCLFPAALSHWSREGVLLLLTQALPSIPRTWTLRALLTPTLVPCPHSPRPLSTRGPTLGSESMVFGVQHPEMTVTRHRPRMNACDLSQS